MQRTEGWRRLIGPMAMLTGMATVATPAPARAEIDRSRYISPDEIRPGMKGFGRTVMAGTTIETFELEVISVMRNAYYAKQDVILIRCSGLNLEHSGVVGGMSGSPCYIREEQTGKERLFGAVAFGWSFGKDPICGVQPITQMADIPEIRRPDKPPPAGSSKRALAPARESGGGRAAGYALAELMRRVCPEPTDEASRFSILNGPTEPLPARRSSAPAPAGQLRPLMTPVTVSAASDRTMAFLSDWFERFGLVPIASGGASEAAQAEARNVELKPGSVLCVPLVTGDIQMEALGTCTEVDGDRVLGFGHSLFGTGSVELPLATGFVHTVIPSVLRSSKLGGALKTVGTLWGDEATGIFGTRGKTPKMVPLDVIVTDLRGQRSYHYDVVHEEFMTPALMRVGLLESIFAHSDPPREHSIRYVIEAHFEGLGAYRTSNFTSQRGMLAISLDLMVPMLILMDAPFGKAKATRARVEVTIEEGARVGLMDEVTMAKTVFEPGETVTVHIRWFHFRQAPKFTDASYALTLPADIPDGEYELTVGSAQTYLSALQSSKPHLFTVETLAETIEALNLIGSFPENRLYMRLGLPTGGVAVKRVEMPELPSFRRKILADTLRSDVRAYSEALVVQHETGFHVGGQRSLSIQVSRRADQ